MDIRVVDFTKCETPRTATRYRGVARQAAPRTHHRGHWFIDTPAEGSHKAMLSNDFNAGYRSTSYNTKRPTLLVRGYPSRSSNRPAAATTPRGPAPDGHIIKLHYSPQFHTSHTVQHPGHSVLQVPMASNQSFHGAFQPREPLLHGNVWIIRVACRGISLHFPKRRHNIRSYP